MQLLRKFPCRYKAACYALALLSMACINIPASSQTLTEDRPFSFGRFVMSDNSSPKDIVLHSNGSYTADPAYVFYAEEPILGRYIINGQVADATMDIVLDVAATSIAPSGGGIPRFYVVSPFTVPATVVTDSNGYAMFEVGATLRSDGMGGVFQTDSYSGQFVISVSPQ